MTKNKRLWATYVFIATMTVVSASFAESDKLSTLLIILLCFSVAFKGRLVIDEFMGLRHASVIIRYAMHLYLIIMPAFFAIALLFPESLARITTIY